MGSVSMQDMAAMAQGLGEPSDFRISEDIGNVIDIGGGSIGDDLGLNMIANMDKMDSGGGGGGGGNSYSIPAFQSSSGGGGIDGGGLGGIELTPLEPLEPISIGGSELPSGMGGENITFRREDNGSGGGMFSNQQSATGPGVSLATSMRDPEAEKKEKVDYLNKLQRLEQKGFPVAHKFTMDNSLEEIKQEYMRLVDARQLETSIKFQRQMLMGAITGMEWMNGRFDPFDLKLDGWSESVHENLEDFDEIFEELYDKYKDRGKMSPEMRLMMAIGGSGFMCHVSNSFFRQKMPSMDDVLRRNPDLARQMASAAAQSAGPGFGNFMGMAMGMNGGGGGGGGGMMNGVGSGMGDMGGAPMPAGPPGMSAGPTASPTGAFFDASPASARPPAPMSGRSPAVPTPESRPTARKEMRGPNGVDDILRTFEEVRRAEIGEQRQAPSANGMASQPAVAAAEIASLHSDDFASQADTVRTGATGGRRRRRAQPPVGNTVSLNV